jgi:hypothetical protein
MKLFKVLLLTTVTVLSYYYTISTIGTLLCVLVTWEPSYFKGMWTFWKMPEEEFDEFRRAFSWTIGIIFGVISTKMHYSETKISPTPYGWESESLD